ncbi:hypothetical protein TKK_0012024 [Trichogramma kaykai]
MKLTTHFIFQVDSKFKKAELHTYSKKNSANDQRGTALELTTIRGDLGEDDKRSIPTAGPSSAASDQHRVTLKISIDQSIQSIENKSTQTEFIMRPYESYEQLICSDGGGCDARGCEATCAMPPMKGCNFMMVGWDSFRTKSMILLLVLFVIWAAIFFPFVL